MRISDWSSDVCSSDLGTYNRDSAQTNSFVSHDRCIRSSDAVCGDVTGGKRPSGGCEARSRTGALLWFRRLVENTMRNKMLSTGRFDCQQVDSLESRSEEHTSELQSLMRISYAVFCL